MKNSNRDVMQTKRPIPQEEQLIVLLDVLRQIKLTDRHVIVTWDGKQHNVTMHFGNN